VFEIREYPIKPVATRGKYYKRVKNSNHLLSVSEVVDMHLQTINSSWDAYPDAIHTLDDISMEKVQAAINIMRDNGLTINESPLAFMRKYDLLRDGKLTNAAYLLFKSNDSFVTTIELGRFQDSITIKDTARTKADVLTQIEQVLDFVRKHINKQVIITGDARNTQKWQYPMEAIREIVINMVIHRDYRSASDSIVKIFDNKIEFYNPGHLPDEITIVDLLSGNYKSNPRNKLIADLCKDMHLIEKYGSGIGRIFKYFKEYGLSEPEFRNISDGFQVTVFGERATDTPPITPQSPPNHPQLPPITPPITEMEERFMELIRQNAKITRKDMAAALAVSINVVKEYLEKLKRKGILERKGDNRTGYWEIKNMPITPQSPPITEMEERFMELIRQNAQITRKDMAVALAVSINVVKEYLEKLKRKGVLERKGNNRTGYWEIKNMPISPQSPPITEMEG
jgi:ATP-dependent DNA helicase RecG